MDKKGKIIRYKKVYTKTKLPACTWVFKPKTKLEGQIHQVELLLQKMKIKHRYTRVRRPQTNGKVERLNRTISEEFLTKIKFENKVYRVAELRLYEYYYNLDKMYQGIKT